MENTGIPATDRIDALERKIDAIYASVEKTRKYIVWRAIISVVLFIVPLIALAIAIPYYLKTLSPYLSL